MNADLFGNTLVIFGFLAGIIFLIAFIISLVWVHRDAEARGKTGCLWALIVFFTWPLGLLVYFLLRDRVVQL